MGKEAKRADGTWRGRGAVAALGGLVLWLAFGTGAARAATTCSFDLGGATLTVAGDPVAGSQLQIGNSGEILVYHRNGSGINVVGCLGGTATVTNTDTIEVTHDQAGDSDEVVISHPEEFAPGLTDEQLGMFDLADEIEVVLDLGFSGADELIISGSGGFDDDIVLGSDGLDWNPGGLVSDADIITDESIGISRYRLSLVSGNDVFSAQGGAGTGDPIDVPMEVSMGDGRDRATGGDGPDSIDGHEGRDSIKGEAGNDDLTGGAGPDSLRGGAGHDRLFAKDGKRDRRIDCGPGAADGATRDAKDPAPKSC